MKRTTPRPESDKAFRAEIVLYCCKCKVPNEGKFWKEKTTELKGTDADKQMDLV